MQIAVTLLGDGSGDKDRETESDRPPLPLHIPPPVWEQQGQDTQPCDAGKHNLLSTLSAELRTQ